MLREAGLAALVARLDADPDLVVVGVEPALARYLDCQGDPRLLDVPDGPTRAALGAGLALAGRRVVTFGHAESAAGGPLPSQPQVLLATSLIGARRWWAAGAVVARPVTAADVAPLLDGALTAGVPVVLRLDEPGPLARVPARGRGPVWGRPRILVEGDQGVVVGQGPQLDGLRQPLEDAGLTLVDLHSLGPSAVIAPGALDDAVLVGGPGRRASAARGDLMGLARLPLPVDAIPAARSATLLHLLPDLRG